MATYKIDRKKKVEKIRRRRIVKAVSMLLGLGIFFFTLDIVLKSSIFLIQEIRVEGAETLKHEQLLAESDLKTNINLFSVSTEKASIKLKKNPWIKKVAVRKALPNKLVIKLQERRPFAYLVTGKKGHLIDEEGFMIAQVKGPQNLPRIELEEALETRVGKRIEEASIRHAIKILGRLHYRTPEKVRWLSINEHGEIKLFLVRKVEVLVGFPVSLSEKMASLLSVLKKADEKKQQLLILDVRVPSYPTARSIPDF